MRNSLIWVSRIVQLLHAIDACMGHAHCMFDACLVCLVCLVHAEYVFNAHSRLDVCSIDAGVTAAASWCPAAAPICVRRSNRGCRLCQHGPCRWAGPFSSISQLQAPATVPGDAGGGAVSCMRQGNLVFELTNQIIINLIRSFCEKGPVSKKRLIIFLLCCAALKGDYTNDK